MKNRALDLCRGREVFQKLICDVKAFPLSFRYGDTKYTNLDGFALISENRSENAWEAAFRVDECITLTVRAKYCPEYGESEYTCYFENTGNAPSLPISDMAGLDTVFDGENPLLRGILGDHGHQYAPYENDLTKQSTTYASLGGRATHICFPYFNLVHGNGGTLMAIGWAGTWDSMFTSAADRTRVILRSNPGLNTVLLPGETLRTALIVLIPYAGRSEDDAMNLWRRWFIEYNMPRADAEGHPLKPFSTVFIANDTGRPNSDGSISEGWDSWRPSLEKIVAEDVCADFRWFDAGWYPDPAGNSVERDWWGTIGCWQIDHKKWPGNSFRESSQEFRRHGMKTFVWFEPERTTHVDDMVRNHGYKREWAIETTHSITNNIGNPECLAWTTDRIISMMEENDVDFYREDNNANHNETWKKLDSEGTERLKMPRWGLSENNSIVGHYQLWDNILAYCASHGKCTFVDSCASGGGRNDIESLRRGVPVMRSDADRTTVGLRLSMTSSFCKWIPFHGSCTKETSHELAASTGAGSDGYVYRASYLPIFNYGEAFTHNPELDFDRMRKYIKEWRSIRHLLTEDMYLLSPWHPKNDPYNWTALAYDKPDTGESLLLAFRREQCGFADYRVKLPFAEPGARYTLTDADTGAETVYSGDTLLDGITLTIPEPRGCLMYRIRKN